MVESLRNLHLLEPCTGCDVRMAQPDLPLCTVCTAELFSGIEAA